MNESRVGAVDAVTLKAWIRARWRVLLAGAFVFIVIVAAFAVRGGAATPACERRTFEGSLFTVCTYDARKQELRLVWQRKGGNALRTFAALADDLGGDARRVRFAMNAGMFNAEGSPIGLYVERGTALRPISTADGPGNFHMKPNGIFSVDQNGAVHVETTPAYLARAQEPRWATQSGPMLVIDGALHPAINGDGPSRTIRNGVGARDAHTALFVISEAPVSFGRFARFFRDDLKCADALFLDGAVSALWTPRTGRKDSGYEVGPMVVVLDRY